MENDKLTDRRLGMDDKGKYFHQMLDETVNELETEESIMGNAFRATFPIGLKFNNHGYDFIMFSNFMNDMTLKTSICFTGVENFFIEHFFNAVDEKDLITLIWCATQNEVSPVNLEYMNSGHGMPLHFEFPHIRNTLYQNAVNYLVRRAKGIDREEKIAKSLLLMYKKAYKKEYNTLKKYKTIDPQDVLFIVDEYEGIEEVYAISRILFFAEELGIEFICQAVLWELLNREWDRTKYDKQVNCYTRSSGLHNDYEAKEKDKKEAERLLENKKMIDKAAEMNEIILSVIGYNEEFSYFTGKEEKNFGRLENDAPYCLAAMRKSLTYKTSDEEKLLAFMFEQTLFKIRNFYELQKEWFYKYLTVKHFGSSSSIKSIWEEPEKPKTPAQISSETNALKMELSNLKVQMLKKDDEIRAEKEKSKKLERSLREEVREKEMYRKKVESIRAASKEESSVKEEISYPDVEEIPEVPEATLDEMKEILKNKNYCIVGGHQNWTYKVKELFPKWKFISAKATSTVNDSSVDNADKIYFFTDTLSHSSYERFIALARTRNIPFGYVKSINMDKLIKELYEDMDE